MTLASWQVAASTIGSHFLNYVLSIISIIVQAVDPFVDNVPDVVFIMCL